MGGGWAGFGASGTGMEAGGVGATGGQLHFQAGLGFFPSLFGLQFVSATTVMRCYMLTAKLTLGPHLKPSVGVRV